MQLFMNAFYGERGYARPAVGTDESLIRSLGRPQSLVKQNQRPLVPLILIVGDTRGTGLVAAVASSDQRRPPTANYPRFLLVNRSVNRRKPLKKCRGNKPRSFMASRQ